MKKRLHVWLALLGVLLMLPAAWLWQSRSASLRPVEEHAAFERLATVPLSRIEERAPLRFTVAIPDNLHWKRIRRLWGDPGYIIAAISPDRKYMYCWNSLELDVQAMVGTERVALEPANYPLYGYSAQCQFDG